MKTIKSDIKWRVYVVYFTFCLSGIAILAQVFRIQTVEKERWMKKAEEMTMTYVNIEAARGNIFAADGSLLATSLPIYEVHMDPNTEALTDETFTRNIDSLCIRLAGLFGNRSAETYKAAIVKARRKGSRYHLIRRNVRYADLRELKTFPIFRHGRYKGGLIVTQKNRRVRPFRLLAARTIGYEREGVQDVGLEGAYSEYLSGVGGKRLMQKIAGNTLMPVNDRNEVEPKDGFDIVTTIDVNIQDVAEHALLKQLTLHDADHGCVVLMEVATGKVRAIANLSRNEDGSYYENYNYAIGESTEPGSTFKLASLMAALEDGLVEPDDSVETGHGKVKYYDRIMSDSHTGGFGKISVKRAFEVSSNVGISTVIQRCYAKNPGRFTERLHAMGLNTRLGLSIAGEGRPYVKTPESKSWSGTSLPWMSIGYEVSHTPMQILAFYNAVANNGALVRPRFVESINRLGRAVETFETEVINPAICSEATLRAAREMLEGVVANGTAMNLSNAIYQIAGKTGTAQIANDKYGYRYRSLTSYQASFVGYFPADEPKYSCIVVVNAPSRAVYYGNLVAGPIFKEIADKVYAGSLDMHEPVNGHDTAAAPAPVVRNGHAGDVIAAGQTIGVPLHARNDGSTWIVSTPEDTAVTLRPRRIEKELAGGRMPDLRGMGVMDVIYLLENRGVHVIVYGHGAVRSQSVPPGSPLRFGDSVTIRLDT